MPRNDRPNARANDPKALERLFRTSDDLLSLWIAEPYVPLAPGIVDALQSRAQREWYGYEVRPPDTIGAFWEWAVTRHGWDGHDLHTSVSPSIGTSIALLLEDLTDPGDGVILQPPVFTEFKPTVVKAGRSVVRSPLVLTDDGYHMDLNDLESKASDPATKALILCNPHNPVGRVWTPGELASAAEICARHNVFVIADEIHADLALLPHEFTPFASTADATGVSWAALHGPIKTFGLAGVCDTLVVTDRKDVTDRFRKRIAGIHASRNNVFSIAAFEAGYRTGAEWLDGFLDLVSRNMALLRAGLPDGIDLVEPEGTYLAWLDFRDLEMDVPELARWLPQSAGLALSPGHWFGREGAGFARMTIATPPTDIEAALNRLVGATATL
ncbi:MAG: aminotransferase class I/II-fold pyridoxal phosphate-dependent enzyme [Actinomycetota bacterium]